MNPLAATVKSAAYFFGGLFFAWNLLALYGFSTMSYPELYQQQQYLEMIRRILFENGLHQTIYFIVLSAGALICFALCAMNLWSRVTGVQMETKNSRNSIRIIVLALIVLGIICFALA